MAAEAAAPRFGRRVRALAAAVLLLWLACAGWNFVKPMPPGTHVTSLPARLAESQLDFSDDRTRPGATLQRELAAVDRAEQMIVVDQCPLPDVLAWHLVSRIHARPNLKIVLVTDPRSEIYGGTARQLLDDLEATGIIVARTRLERLRDSNPLYSSGWRLSLGWWSDPFDEAPGAATLGAALRQMNLKANQRHLLVADDGAGGWSSILVGGDASIEVRGHLARDIVASELQVAAWSSGDDRLPNPPPLETRGVGTIDARFLTESAIQAAVRDAIAASGSGDSISIAVEELGDRQLIHALLRAAARGVRIRLVLDSGRPANVAVAAELVSHVAGNLDVRWSAPSAIGTRLVLIQHRNDLWLEMGSANLVRRDLDDLNLEAGIELRMPARAAAARAACGFFATLWAGAKNYVDHADASSGIYWRYRVAEATGLAMF